MKNFFKKTAIFAFVFLGLFFCFNSLLAQDLNQDVLFGGDDTGGAAGINQELGGLSQEDPRVIVARVINILLGFLGVIAVGILMWGGFIWMTSRGEEQKIKKAKDLIKAGLIGLVIILSAFAIVSFIFNAWFNTIGNGDDDDGPDGPDGPGVDSDIFFITGTFPEDKADDIVKNVEARINFSKLVEDDFEDKITIQKIADIDPDTGDATDIAPEDLVVSFVSIPKRIKIKGTESCEVEDDGFDCLPAWSRIKITVDETLISGDGDDLPLQCDQASPCEFYFDTNNSVDLANPMVDLPFTQICQDDGTLTDLDNANLVAGSAEDDWGLGSYDFYYRPDGGDNVDVYTETADFGSSVDVSYKFQTGSMEVGDIYNFGLRFFDYGGNIGFDEFETDIKPGHCCNGVPDMDEEDIDCGGADCEPCNFDLPRIDSVSPVGGFCDNNIDRPCETDSDCVGGGTCDTETPNGAEGNFVTIRGEGFGVIEGFSENVLSSVSFDEISEFPSDWSRSYQSYSNVDLTLADSFSPTNSVLITQDAGQPYPGKCTREFCEGNYLYSDKCTWEGDRCNFDDSPTTCGDCIVSKDADRPWPYTNRVMWTRLAYDISDLEFEPGENYVMRFRYKGKASTNVGVRMAYSLGYTTQSWSRVNDPTCVLSGGDYCSGEPGKCICEENNFYCCLHAPVQTKPYSALFLNTIPAGDYGDWQSYEGVFVFNEKLQELLDRDGNLHLEVGLAIGYNDTTAGGTEFYVDDFIFARIPETAEVSFMGDENNEADDKLAMFPVDVNPQCSGVWNDDEIIVVVPPGAETGEIKVKAENGRSDRTGDAVKGPLINDFVVNNIERPGLCRVNPNFGETEDSLTYYGTRLLNSSPYFGNKNSNLPVINPNIQGNDIAYGAVPNIANGLTTTFVSKVLEGVNVYSNFLKFNKLGVGSGPKITSFSPKTGPEGQYVSIYGSGFGSQKGASRVFFSLQGGGAVEAGYDFPAICANSLWRDDQVIVKVPVGLSDDTDYLISMSIVRSGEVFEIDSSSLVEPTFKFDEDEPLRPSLCRLEPIMGPAETDVSLYGEYFGAKASGDVLFAPTENAGIISWADLANYMQIDTQVPTGAVTGPVRVEQSGVEGNGINFNVGKCTDSADPEAVCGAGYVCCPEGSLNEFRCISEDNNENGTLETADCYAQIANSVYEFEFDTGLADYDCEDTDKPFECEDGCCSVECDPVDGSCPDPDPKLCSGGGACFDGPACEDGEVCDVNSGCTCVPEEDLVCQSDDEPYECKGEINDPCCNGPCDEDGLCPERPNVVSENPADEATEVCTNIEISAGFDKKMNEATFSGNMIVLAEKDGQCPSGSNYLTKTENNKGFLKNLVFGVKKFFKQVALIFKGDKALADSPSNDKNYCQINGTLNLEHSGDTSEAVFRPADILEESTKYFVIITGDENLDHTTGVKDTDGRALVGNFDYEFNGVSFKNAHIWSFTTMGGVDQTDGICQIDRVIIKPENYLFKTNEDDRNDNDQDESDFDTLSDADKVYRAKALSADGNVLVQVPGVYEWDWDWSGNMIDSLYDIYDLNGSALGGIGSLPSTQESFILKAESDKIFGESNLAVQAIDGAGDPSTQTMVYLFACEHPWPSEAANGSWSPWTDKGTNCDEGDPCPNTDFRFYYCRDAGESEVFYDDLPAFQEGNEPYIKGTTGDFYKDFYFLRKDLPQGQPVSLEGNSLPQGNAVHLSWGVIPDINQYKIYYGEDQDNLNNSVSVNFDTEVELGKGTPYPDEIFDNEKNYYFAVAGVGDNGEETGLYYSSAIFIEDTQGPIAPEFGNITVDSENIYIDLTGSWSGNDFDVFSSRMYFRAYNGDCSSLNIDDYAVEFLVNTNPVNIYNLTPDTNYCFAMLNYDRYSNASTPEIGNAKTNP